MDTEQLLAMIADKVGIDSEQAQKVVNFLIENKEGVLGALGGDAMDQLKDKLPAGLGGLLGD